MIKVFHFSCGTRVFFVDSEEIYYVEEPDQTLVFSSPPYSLGLEHYSERTDWKYFNLHKTYKEWFKERNIVRKESSTENVLKKV